MKQYQYLLATLLTLGLTIVSGAVFGKMSNRWGPSKYSLAAAEKLESLPEDFGAWKLQSSEEMTETTVAMLECSGYISRVYVNQESGEVVNVAVILGPAGPIAVHTPEVCYSSRAHKALGQRKSITIGDSDDKFWALTFEKNDLSASLIRVYYGWTRGNQWVAAKDPRFAFATSPYLYKIQLASYLPAGTDLEGNDPCENFLADFVPLLRDYLIDCSDDR